MIKIYPVSRVAEKKTSVVKLIINIFKKQIAEMAYLKFPLNIFFYVQSNISSNGVNDPIVMHPDQFILK